jgi:hypothetical protein
MIELFELTNVLLMREQGAGQKLGDIPGGQRQLFLLSFIVY